MKDWQYWMLAAFIYLSPRVSPAAGNITALCFMVFALIACFTGRKK